MALSAALLRAFQTWMRQTYIVCLLLRRCLFFPCIYPTPSRPGPPHHHLPKLKLMTAWRWRKIGARRKTACWRSTSPICAVAILSAALLGAYRNVTNRTHCVLHPHRCQTSTSQSGKEKICCASCPHPCQASPYLKNPPHPSRQLLKQQC